MLMTQLAHPIRHRSSRRPRDRRGVLLLVVLGMLAMFGLIGLAFVMLTGHARRGAEALRRKEFYVENPQKFTNETLLQILRGTNNPTSVLQNHSLLEDVYGNNTVGGVTYEVADLAGGVLTGGADSTVQLMDIKVGENQTFDFGTLPFAKWPKPEELSELDQADGRLKQSGLCGRVLTFITGPAAGQSVRIVGWQEIDYSMDSGNPKRGMFRIVSPTKVPDRADKFVINGAPFSGTGFGYNIKAGADTPQVSARLRSWTPDTSRDTTMDLTNATPPAPQEPMVALLPNPAGFNAEDIFDPAVDNPANYDLGYDDPSGPGGANEDYDAVDYQNMLMALQLPDGHVPSPSLHRPALVNYWMEQLDNIPGVMLANPADRITAIINPDLVAANMADTTAGPAIVRDLKRRMTLRPLSDFHPDFTGSNERFYPLWDGVNPAVQDIHGDGSLMAVPEWDVDNDGDGIKDSIWVDLGLPVQTMKDGRQFKPLVAILCVDLDGRLNLNAHGNLAQIDTGSNAFDTPIGCNQSIPDAGAVVPQPATSRGQGSGPAEVDLSGLLNPTEYSQLLIGTWDTTDTSKVLIPGRYGYDALPGSSNTQLRLAPNIRASTFDLYGYPYDFTGYPVDYTGANELADHIANPGDILHLASDFGSPIDLKGVMQVSLDWRGQPVYQTVWLNAVPDPANWTSTTTPINWTNTSIDLQTTPTTDALVGQPYEMDLSAKAAQGDSKTSPDASFSPPELERLLRPYDIDTMNLPDRLETLAPGLMATNNNRRVTTESWDIASTPCAVTADILTRLATARGSTNADAKTWLDQFPAGLPQRLAAQLRIDGMLDAAIQANFATIGNELLGPELMAGLPLNLNHKFRDRTANMAENREDRRTMARHIYCLAMLLADMTYLDSVAWELYTDTDPGPGNYRPYTARLLAQWAINVVDFRCNDSVMTGFEYDENPFINDDTANDAVLTSLVWDLDNDIDNELNATGGTVTSADDTGFAERGFVWGAARPELLITETLALHNRNTGDLDTEIPEPASDPANRTTDPPPRDSDFDQEYRPQGSLFVELFNPSSPYSPKDDALYDTSGANVDTHAIELDARTAGNSPIWRFLIVRVIDDTSTNVAASYDEIALKRDPGDPDVNLRPPIPVTPGDTGIVKSIYFYDPGVGVDLGDDGERLIAAAPPATLLPGRYAVMGPSNVVDVNHLSSGGANSRRIELQPDSDNTQGNQIQALNLATPNPIVGTDILNPISIVVPDLNVSEPSPLSGGYDALLQPAELARFDGTVFNPPLDQPLDPRRTDDIAAMVIETDTWPRAFIIHLQRLADPENDYDADTNPYQTVDSLPIDLITYNGADVDDDMNGAGNIKFESRQRGEITTNFSAVGPLWQSRIDEKTTTPPQAVEPASLYRFPYTLSQTLGFLNEPFGVPLALGSNNPYNGSPQTPFPWFNWNSRPYMSKNEILLVPCASSARVLQYYGMHDGQNDFILGNAGPNGAGAGTGAGSGSAGNPLGMSNDPNDPGGAGTGGTRTGVAGVHDADVAVLGNFPHMLNFFNSASVGTVGSDAAELHRILDYVRVPSRFTRTREPFMNAGFATPEEAEQAREITDQREPGRVNLNTVVGVDPTVDGDIWDGAVGVGIGEPLVNQVDLTAPLNPAFPTRFQNPFRSSNGLGLVPTAALMGYVDREVNATLLREGPTPGTPLFTGVTHGDYDDTTRNPYFRYLPLTRLGNTAGTRSNVYAVWVTVGYFEVEPAVQIPGIVTTADELAKIYPDGVRIGQEVGADSGEVERNRAFYIIDRSIPVGFKRGEDLNVKDAVLVERDIE